MTAQLKRCPFCGSKPPSDLIDTLYPSGIWWREIEGGDGLRSYHSHSDRQEGDSPCYRMGCDVHNGGCGVEATADTVQEVIAVWNRRPMSKGMKWLVRCWKELRLVLLLKKKS